MHIRNGKIDEKFTYSKTTIGIDGRKVALLVPVKEGKVEAGECRIRACCDVNMYPTCASCTEYVDIRECRIFNSLFSRVMDFVKRADRHAGVEQNREIRIERHAARMASLGRAVMRRR